MGQQEKTAVYCAAQAGFDVGALQAQEGKHISRCAAGSATMEQGQPAVCDVRDKEPACGFQQNQLDADDCYFTGFRQRQRGGLSESREQETAGELR